MPAWAADDEPLRSAFEAARRNTMRPVHARAVTAYEVAARIGRATRWPSPPFLRALDGLARLEPDRFSVPHELHGEPSWEPAGGADPAPVTRARP